MKDNEIKEENMFSIKRRITYTKISKYEICR